MKFTFAIIIFITLTLPAFSQFTSWEQVGNFKVPGPEGGHYLSRPVDYHAADSLNFILVTWLSDTGESIYVWQTTDGGDSWNIALKDTAIYERNSENGVVYHYDPPTPWCMTYPNNNLCIIGCSDGYYWRSTDNCKTWEKLQTNKYQRISRISFYDDNFGFAVYGYKIYSSIDGGLTWNLSFDPDIDTAKFHAIYNFEIISKDTCFINFIDNESKAFLLKTSNQGKTWTTTTNRDEFMCSKLCFIDSQRGFRAGVRALNSTTRADLIIYTSDGGETWEPALDTVIGKWGGFSKIDFYDDQRGFAFGFPDRLWLTFDGGETWTLDKNLIEETGNYIVDMESLSSNRFLALTYSEYFYRGTILHVSVEEQPKHPERLLLFPNPAKNVLNIKLPETLTPTELSIYNILGEKVLSAETQSPEAKLNISSLPSGVYTVRATINDTEYSEKFVKVE